MKQYMIIESFKPGKVKAVYERFEEKGRLMSKGLNYIDSWVSEDLRSCFQIVESESIKNIKTWISQWEDLVEFEVIPILDSNEAKSKVLAS